MCRQRRSTKTPKRNRGDVAKELRTQKQMRKHDHLGQELIDALFPPYLLCKTVENINFYGQNGTVKLTIFFKTQPLLNRSPKTSVTIQWKNEDNNNFSVLVNTIDTVIHQTTEVKQSQKKNKSHRTLQCPYSEPHTDKGRETRRVTHRKSQIFKCPFKELNQVRTKRGETKDTRQKDLEENKFVSGGPSQQKKKKKERVKRQQE